MTLRHVDSMALYSTDAEATKAKWTATAGTLTYRGAGRNTGAYNLATSSGTSHIGRDLSLDGWTGANVGVVVGCAIKPNSDASGFDIMTIRDGSNTNTTGVHLAYAAASGWSLKLGLGTSSWGSAVATSAASTSTWDYHEIKILPGGTNGAASRVIWKKNGTQVYDSGAGAVDIKSSTMSHLSFGNMSNSGSVAATAYYTDLYICDNTGSNADFLGDTRIECLLPTGDGHKQDFAAAAQNLLTYDQFSLEGSQPYTSDTASPFAAGGTISQYSGLSYLGTYSLLIQSTGGALSPGATIIVPVKPSTTYTLAWRGAGVNNGAGVSGLVVGTLLSNTQASLGSAFTNVSTLYALNTFSTDSVTFTTSSTTAFVKLQFSYNGSTSTRGVAYDTIGLYQGSTAYYIPPGSWGNAWQLPKDDDTSYLRSGVDGAVQTFAYGDLASVSGNVVGVVVSPWARAENTGTRQLQPAFTDAGANDLATYFYAATQDDSAVGGADWPESTYATNRLTIPSTIQEADEMFILKVTGTTTTGPTGWTLIASWIQGQQYQLYHRTALSTDANMIVSVPAGGTDLWGSLLFAYRGCRYSAVSTPAHSNLSSGISSPAVTPSSASLLVQLWTSFIASGDSGASFNVATGVTSRRTSYGNGARYMGFRLTDEAVAASVAGGSHFATWSGGAVDQSAITITLTGLKVYTGSTASPGSVNNDLAYHVVPLVVESNPVTSAAWTISDVNAVEAGVKLN